MPWADPVFEVSGAQRPLPCWLRWGWGGGIFLIYFKCDYYSIYTYFKYDILQIRFFDIILYIFVYFIYRISLSKNRIWNNFKGTRARCAPSKCALECWRGFSSRWCLRHRYPYWGLQPFVLPWRHNEGNGVSNHRRLDCLHNRLFRCR